MIKIGKSIINITFFCAFLLPTYYLKMIFGLDITEYLFLFFVLFLYFSLIFKSKEISKIEFLSIFLIFIICVVKKTIVPLYLFEFAFAYKYSKILVTENEKYDYLISKLLLGLSLVGVLVYSILFFGNQGRYIYTGLNEINQSGFGIFMLFIIIRRYNKNLGTFLLLIGLFTFSRNYLLSLFIYFLFEKLKNNENYGFMYKHFGYNRLIIIALILLVGLSFSFDYAYHNNQLSEYQTGIKKYTNLYDYSNYFRFSINTRLLKIYTKHPKYLLTGLTDNQFFKFSSEIANSENVAFRMVKPHNYFFSYLRIYGVFAILIFIILSKILHNLINKNNYHIFLIIFIYANILGIGFSNYWLFMSLITLYVYREREENYE